VVSKKNTRREFVPFNPYYFETQKKEGAAFSVKETFTKIYLTNHWKAKESISGAGSENSQTTTLIIKLRSY